MHTIKLSKPQLGLLKCALHQAMSSAGVSRWTPLTTAFNNVPAHKLNLSLTQEDQGLFGVPELQSHEGFFALQERAYRDSDLLLAECCSPNRSRKMVEVFDELSDTLCRVADLAEFIRIAHPKAAYSHAAEQACISISSIVEVLNTNRQLYAALHDVVENGDKFLTNDVDNHVSKLFLFDFEQCGIHLQENERQGVVRLNDHILQVGQRFMNGSLNPRSIPRDMIPQHIRNLFPSVDDQILITGLYAETANASARETAYKQYLYPDKHQEYLLDDLLTSRHELAQLCGFPTFAHRSLKASTAETPDTVHQFLDILTTQLHEPFQQDLAHLRKRQLGEYPNSKDLAVWDIPYYSQLLRREWFAMKSTEFSSYFSLGMCMEGLNILMNHLFNINLVHEDVTTKEVWSQDVYKLAVVHNTEGLLGHIYCDFYERAGKPNQDCHFTILGGRELPDGSYQNPVVVLMLNFPIPRWSMPSLLTAGMVDNLFHEMGHAMHSMLARTRYQHVTGTRCATDFAEVPSILMENFASDPRFVRMFAKHYRTHEPIPEDMLARLCASKHLFAAAETQVQVFYSALDQRYHGTHPLGGSTTEVLMEVQEKFYGLPYVPDTAWQLRFFHLVGYGSKYYSYLLSRAVSSWIWQQYFQDDPLSSSSGEKYRHECLAHGGGKPSRELVAQFLGRDVTPHNLAQSLVNDLEAKKDIINRLQ